MTSDSSLLLRIDLHDSEDIVEHGTRRTEWYLRSGSGWLRAARAPNASTRPVNVGPGTVWQICIELSLPAGLRLMRVQVSPRLEPARDAFSHLLKGSRGPALQTRRNYYRVGKRGELEPDLTSDPR